MVKWNKRDLSRRKDESDLWKRRKCTSSRLKNSSIDKRKQNFEIIQMEKSKNDFGFFLFLTIGGNLISKRCERNGVISACHATRLFLVLIYFSSINCSTCCSLIRDASTFSSMKSGKEGGGKKKKK